jgi:hypothetical protein
MIVKGMQDFFCQRLVEVVCRHELCVEELEVEAEEY